MKKIIVLIFVISLIISCTSNTKRAGLINKSDNEIKKYLGKYTIEELSDLISESINMSLTENELADTNYFVYPQFYNQITKEEIRTVFDTISDLSISEKEYIQMFEDINFLFSKEIGVDNFIKDSLKHRVDFQYQIGVPLILVSTPLFIDNQNIVVIYAKRLRYLTEDKKQLYNGTFFIWKLIGDDWYCRNIFYATPNTEIRFRINDNSVPN